MDKDFFRDRPSPDFYTDASRSQLPRADKPFVRHTPERQDGSDPIGDIAIRGVARVHPNDDSSELPPTAEFPRRAPADQSQTMPQPVSLPEPAHVELEEVPAARVEAPNDNGDDVAGSDATLVRAAPDHADQLSPVKRMIGSVESDTTLEERHPDWPKVTLHFHFGPHGNAEHFQKLPELMNEADVYCFEDTGGNGNVGLFNQLSNTLATEADIEQAVDQLRMGNGRPVRGTPMETQIRAFMGTGTVLGHFDIRPGEGNEALIRMEYRIIASKDNRLEGTLDDTLESLESTVAALSDVGKRRDGIMLGPTENDEGGATAGRFEQEMDRIFTEYPELKNRPEIRALDTHGSQHTPLYHRARAAGVSVERSFSEMPYSYSSYSELARKIDVGIEPTREFMIQVFADESLREGLIATAAIDDVIDDPDVVRYVRERARTFTEDDAKQIHDVRRQERQQHAAPVLTKQTLDRILQSKGFGPLPSNRDELRAEIATQKAALAEKKEEVQRDMEERRRQARHGA